MKQSLNYPKRVTWVDIEAFAQTIYGTARGKPFILQLAFAHMLLNRWRTYKPHILTGKLPSLLEVCKRSGCWGKSDELASVTLENLEFLRSLAIVAIALSGLGNDPTRGNVVCWRADKHEPSWASRMENHVTICGWVFCRLKKEIKLSY